MITRSMLGGGESLRDKQTTLFALTDSIVDYVPDGRTYSYVY